MANAAPIALFAFNRPQQTAATLEALAANDLAARSELVVFCDGPRRPEEEASVREVRDLVTAADGFREVTVVERPRNLGLARSLITGITEILEAHASVIVVEDDLVSSPFFLAFMNEGLRRYADDQRVFSICGYAYPVWRELSGPFFLPGAHPWGWATWRRAWAHFEEDQAALLAALADRRLLYDFDIAGSFPHTSLLMQSISGEVHSWALRWIGSAILHDALTLYPSKSLIHNIGIGEQATNQWGDEVAARLEAPLADSRAEIPDGPPQPNARALALLREFHLAARSTPRLRDRLFDRLLSVAPEHIERRLYDARLRRAVRTRRAR